MKFRHFIWISLAAILSLYACIDDKGSYDYIPADKLVPVEISGLNDTNLTVLTKVTLTPDLKGIENEEDYEFTWYTLSMKTGVLVKRDTIGRKRNLTFVVDYPAGETHYLHYDVKHKRTGVSVSKVVTISIVTDLSYGTVILKEVDGGTDLDFITSEGDIRENLISTGYGAPMSGKPVDMSHQTDYTHYYYNENGQLVTLPRQRVLFVASANDMVTYNSDNMAIVKSFEEAFYAPPAIKAPQMMHSSVMLGGGSIFMNDNKVYTIGGGAMDLGIGKFSDSRGYHRGHDGITFSEAGIMKTAFAPAIIGFSPEKRSFIYVDHTKGNYVDTFPEPQATDPMQLSPNNMTATPIWLGYNTTAYNESTYGIDPSGLAIMKENGSSTHYYLKLVYLGSRYPFVVKADITADKQVLTADCYAGHAATDGIYFGKGNALWYYQPTGSEWVIHTFPAGEEIVSITNPKILPFFEEAEILYVLTNTATQWKFYTIPLKNMGGSPEFSEDPFVTYTGNGRAVKFLNK